MQPSSLRLRRAVARLLVLSVLVLAGLPGATRSAHAQDNIIHVNDDATGSGDGSNWADAYTSLQMALSAATAGKEIWVAAGSYIPGASVDSSFQLKNGVAIYGGFAGSEDSREQRDWIVHASILNGNRTVYHVVTGSDLESTAMLDGFTITGGFGNSAGYPCLDRLGGGIYLNASSPTLANLVITGNQTCGGGGMSNSNSNPTLTNVTLNGNQAFLGGGMYNSNSDPTLTNVTLSGNQTPNSGGGIYNSNSDPKLTNVSINGNQADGGGGIYNSNSDPTLTNVSLSGNQATSGSGIYNYNSNPMLTNVTLSGNQAASGSAIYIFNSSPLIQNSIIWGNLAASGSSIYLESGTLTIRYSLIEGGLPAGSVDGGNNLTDDPRFIRAVNCEADGCGDHPDSPPDESADDDLRLELSSPALDTGDNDADLDGPDGPSNATIATIDFDLDGAPRVAAAKRLPATVDLGAYERINPAGDSLYLPTILH